MLFTKLVEVQIRSSFLFTNLLAVGNLPVVLTVALAWELVARSTCRSSPLPYRWRKSLGSCGRNGARIAPVSACSGCRGRQPRSFGIELSRAKLLDSRQPDSLSGWKAMLTERSFRELKLSLSEYLPELFRYSLS
jgi:hypothetical protein